MNAQQQKTIKQEMAGLRDEIYRNRLLDPRKETIEEAKHWRERMFRLLLELRELGAGIDEAP